MKARVRNQKYMVTQQNRNCFDMRCFSYDVSVGQCSTFCVVWEAVSVTHDSKQSDAALCSQCVSLLVP